MYNIIRNATVKALLGENVQYLFVDTTKCLVSMKHRVCRETRLVFALTWVVATLISRETTITSPSCPCAGAGGPTLGPRWWKSCDTTNCKNRHTSVLLHHNGTQTDIPIPVACWAPITSLPSFRVFFGTKLPSSAGRTSDLESTAISQFNFLSTWYTHHLNVQLHVKWAFTLTVGLSLHMDFVWNCILYLYFLLFLPAVYFFNDIDKAGSRAHSGNIEELWREFIYRIVYYCWNKNMQI